MTPFVKEDKVSNIVCLSDAMDDERAAAQVGQNFFYQNVLSYFKWEFLVVSKAFWFDVDYRLKLLIFDVLTKMATHKFYTAQLILCTTLSVRCPSHFCRLYHR